MTDYEQQLQLARERALRYGQQAQYQAPQGRMVGNIYVAPNPLEYLAAGLRSLGGMRGQQMAEDELRQLQTTRQQAVADALRGFNENMQGTPEQVIPNLTQVDDEGNPMPQAIKPAQPQNIPYIDLTSSSFSFYLLLIYLYVLLLPYQQIQFVSLIACISLWLLASSFLALVLPFLFPPFFLGLNW